MKKIVLCVGVIISLLTLLAVLKYDSSIEDEREKYEGLLRDHPLRKKEHAKKPEGEAATEEGPGEAMIQDFLRTMDPKLKRPTPEVMQNLNAQMARQRDQGISARTAAISLATGTLWEERGPKSVGGRTRAVMFDPNDATKKKVWAGGVSGGLWFNNDITDANSTWQKVNDFWDNLAISCIASDPVNPQVFYVGTGEGWFNIDRVAGAGIWKTTNGGATWSQLSSTSSFAFVNDIVVRNESNVGVVYAAVADGNLNGFSSSTNGLFRSNTAGASWTQVLPTSITQRRPTDIEIAKDNKLFVGADPKFTGVQSTIYQSTDGTTWSSKDFSFNGRIELACAPSDQLIAYAVFVNSNKVASIQKTTDGGVNWTSVTEPVDADTGIPSDDFSRGQAWYNLILSVHPTDANNVLVGGIDLFRSTNGGTSWAQISKWSNNNNLALLNVPLVHADQHQIIYRPGFPNEVVFGNDGGVYYTSNQTLTPTSLAISARNINYNVTQFYASAIHPTQTNFLLAGSQDNGTQKFTLPGFDVTTEPSGGDGGFCFIDEKNPSFQIASTTNNSYRLSADGGVTFSTTLLNDDDNGSFINPGDYDSNLKILFSARSTTAIYRIANITSTRNVDSIKVSGLGSMASALRVSPYTTASSTVLVGTEAGKLFKITNANTASPVVTPITAPFPTGSISCISFGASENQILVTFFNYGVVSIWETRNGGTSWVSREGDLPNMPVRWAEYHPQFFDQVYIATEQGVWSTDNINVTTPDWNSTNGGLANVRTDMLRVRKSDRVIMAATHGRGVFTAPIPSELDQVITFDAIAGSKAFGDTPFTINATSTSNLPVTFTSSNPSVATVTGSTITIIAAGTTILTANQSGNIQYKPAPPVTQTVTVLSRIIKISGTLDFDDVIIGEKATKTFLIENAGASPITISNIIYPSGYAGTTTTGANNTTTVNVTFEPTNVIDFNGDIVVNNNGTGNNKIAVTGRGIKITALEQAGDTEELVLSPNPASTMLLIQSKWIKSASSVQLFDIAGKSFQQPLVPTADGKAAVDVSALPSGTYLIAIPVQSKYAVKKFIKN